MRQWQVDRPAGRCCVTGRDIAEGEAFYTVLFEEQEEFRRVDYSAEAWTGPPDGAYCHFQSRVPVQKKAAPTWIGNEGLTAFFVRLADDTEPVRIQFRFVLALMLMRKRLLKYEGTRVEDGREVWDMVLTSAGSRHAVVNPKLTDSEVDGVSRELTVILHGDARCDVERREADPATEDETPA